MLKKMTWFRVVVLISVLLLLSLLLGSSGNGSSSTPTPLGGGTPHSDHSEGEVSGYNASSSSITTFAPADQSPRLSRGACNRDVREPYYPFSSLFPFTVLKEFLSRQCRGGGRAFHHLTSTPTRLNAFVSLILHCHRSPPTGAAAMCRTDILNTSYDYSSSLRCAAKTIEIEACAAAFDTWTLRCDTSQWMNVTACFDEYGVRQIERWTAGACRTTTFWRALVSTHCSSWQCLLPRSANNTTAANGVELVVDHNAFGDVVSRSQRASSSTMPPYVEVEKRTPTPMGPPVVCTTEAGRIATFHPISFAYPKELMIVDHDGEEVLDGCSFSWLDGISRGGSAHVGGSKKAHHVQDEHALLFDLRHSLYGSTTRRWGWDCLRHYEILGSGAVPYFIDLPIAPDTMLTNLPKRALLEALHMPEVRHIGAVWTESSYAEDTRPHTTSSPSVAEDKEEGAGGGYFVYTGLHQQDGGAHVSMRGKKSPYVNVSRWNFTEYSALRTRLTHYTRRHLTTESMAAYVLERMGHPRAKKVLFLHGVRHLDFLTLSLHHGLVNGLGLDVTSYPRNDAHYQRRNVTSLQQLEEARNRYLTRYHGNGYAFGFRVADKGDEFFGKSSAEELLAARIAARDFDVVVATFTRYASSLSTQIPLFHRVVRAYPKDRIALINGDDVWGPDSQPSRLCLYATRFGHVFMRENYALDTSGVCVEQSEDDQVLVLRPSNLSKASLRRQSSSTPLAWHGNESGFCDTAEVVETTLPETNGKFQSKENDVILVNGGGGVAPALQFVKSLRRGAKVTRLLIVVLVWTPSSRLEFAASMGGEHRELWDSYRPYLLHDARGAAGIEEGSVSVSPQRYFLRAVGHFLSSAAALGLRRVLVVEDAGAVHVRHDPLLPIGEREGLWFFRHGVIGHTPDAAAMERWRNMMTSCFWGDPFGKGSGVDLVRSFYIGHELFGGQPHALLELIQEVERVYHKVAYLQCGIEVSVNLLLHNGTLDGIGATVFGAERGPVVFDWDGECAPLARDRVVARLGSKERDVLPLCTVHGQRAAVIVGDFCKLHEAT